MSTYPAILFFILCTYHIMNISEAGPDDPWSLEDEKEFQGEFCDQDTNYLKNVCQEYARNNKENVPNGWILGEDPQKGLSCESLNVTLWSKNDKKDVDTERDILRCIFKNVLAFIANGGGTTVALSKGKAANDVAEYKYNSESGRWVPSINHEGWLAGLQRKKL